MRRYSILLVIALLFNGCNWLDLPDSQTGDLTGTLWELDSIAVAGGETGFTPSGDDEIYNIRFREDGSLEGQNACNDCGGSYELGEGNSIQIGLSCEESACGGDVYIGYDGLILEADSYELGGERLRIYATTSDGEQHVLYHHAAGE